MDVGMSIQLVLIIVILLAVIAVLVLKNVRRTKKQENNSYIPPKEKHGNARKFCVSCGTELESDSAFCTNCGAKQ